MSMIEVKNLSHKSFSIFNKSYSNPSFKLKVVDGSYVLSYELNLNLEDIIESSDKLDIISLIDSNRLVGEFIVIDDNNGYLFYSGLLLKLVKVDINPTEVEYSKNKMETEVLEEDYNSDVGVMIALKTPRRKLDEKSFSDVSYRTLWISFKNNELQPIIEKNNIIIAVKDYGPGLPDHVRAKLFKEMVTTKGKNGTGLGLFMCYSTIKANFHGDMSVESELNKGSTFTITLPYKN